MEVLHQALGFADFVTVTSEEQHFKRHAADDAVEDGDVISCREAKITKMLRLHLLFVGIWQLMTMNLQTLKIYT